MLIEEGSLLETYLRLLQPHGHPSNSINSIARSTATTRRITTDV